MFFHDSIFLLNILNYGIEANEIVILKNEFSVLFKVNTNLIFFNSV